MKPYGVLLLGFYATACTGRSEKTTFAVSLKNDSSKNLEISANIHAPSGDESQCTSGESGKLTVNSKSESALALTIKCTRKNGAWLSGSLRATPLIEDFLTKYKIFSYEVHIRLIRMEPGKINWFHSEKTLPLGAEKNENYVSNEFLYTPGVVKVLQAADFNNSDSWYYKASSYYTFFMITDKTVEKAYLEVDKDLETPYKACDSCAESRLEGQLNGTKYRIEAQAVTGIGISLRITDQNFQNINISCTDLECVLN